MITRRSIAGFLFVLVFVLSGAISAFAQGQTVILDFSTGLAGAGGTITVSGGQATGAGIPVDFLIVSGAHGAPPAGLSYNVDGLGAATPSSDGTTGILEFSTSANYIRILGSVPSLGIAQGALLQGTISDYQVLPSGIIITVVSVGSDAKSPALLNALGIPSNTPFQLFAFQVGAQMGGPAYTVTNVDITNEAACYGGIGDFVWNDLNQNGIQDAGEPGIPNILVELWNSNQSVLLASQVTDAAGLYHFSGVCADTYKVVVPPQAGLTGWTASPTFVGSSATDSNGNPATVVLPPDTLDYTIDFGYFVRSPHLTLVKTPKNGTFFQGDPVSFSFVVGNDGGSPALNVQLSDQLPGNGGLVWMVAAVSQPSCSVSGGNLLTCNFGTIAAGQTATVTVTSVGGTPLAACQSQPNPIALATADGGLSATDSGSLNCVPPQLSIVKTPKDGTFTLGGMVSFTIVVSNPAPAGASPATHVVLTDTLPNAGGLVWDTATPSQGTCTLTSNNLSCALGTIAPGGSVTVIVNSTATTPPAACQLQSNPVARATADGGLDVQDSGSVNCSYTASTTLVTKTVSPGTTVPVGTPVTITVTETNTGNSPITNVNITGTGCTAWTPTSVASLAAGASVDFSCTFTPATTAGWTATGHGTDILGKPVSEEGETTSGTVTVQQASTTLTTKTVSPSTNVITGTVVTITVTETNTGTSAITNVNVTGTGCTTWTPSNVASLAAGATQDFSCTITANANISWTATAHGTDAAGNPASETNETTSGLIKVNPTPSANCVLITAVKGVAITPVTLTGTGGTGGPYTFTATGLPTGLTMSSSGTISGTPTVSGTFTYTVTVKDKDGNVGTSFSCSVTVNPPPSANCVVITAVKGVAITPVTLTGTGGTGGPYTFSATGLPAGLTLSSTGTLSGTPTVSGTFTYTVTVKDKDGNAGTYQCSVTVNPPPSANCVAITAVKGVAITPVTLTGTGGTGGPYTFSATGLPAGLTLSSTGTLSGTPTVSGTFTYTVTVKDKDGNTGTFQCSVTVNPPPSANCAVINAVAGVPITPVTLTGTGGAGGPYTFSATGLPAGLTLSSTGTISGTPTVGGTFTYTVTVTDKNGNKGTFQCSVTVTIPPPQFCSFTPGGWGAPPNGGNVATLLYSYFSSVYGSGGVVVGNRIQGSTIPYSFSSLANYYLKFTSPSAITTFLPNGGTSSKLSKSATNPAPSNGGWGGEFGTQVLALQLNVNFSVANKVPKPGFATAKVVSGPLAGLTATQVLVLANQALGGNTSVLTPYGITIAQFTSILGSVNGSMDNCTTNTGYMR